ncbi:MAG TPA: GNAT family N-acetyltransferase [Brevundimonas sp.]|nr:GNAT family N-acetyltransferase [Brevundimonas sp.]
MALLRQVRPGDWPALNELHRWAWFPERSEQGWLWLHQLGQDAPGWVLEDADGVCGYLGNIRQDYSLASTRLTAATGYSLIVLPRAHGGSKPLLEAFRAQPGVFATSILNGNARSALIYARNGFLPFPKAWANVKIVWPLAPFTILSERVARSLYRRQRPSRELFSSLKQGIADPGPPQLVALDPWTDAAAIDRFDGELRRSGLLVASRSARALQARFSNPDSTVAPLLYGWCNAGDLVALALAQVGKMSECEAAVLDVIDLSWLVPEGRSPAAALLAELKAYGRRIGASRLRLSVVNEATAALAQCVPGALIRRGYTHSHVSFADKGSEPLWRPTPYDGDFGFILRPPPVSDRARLDLETPASSDSMIRRKGQASAVVADA